MQIDSASLYLFVKELQKLLIPAQVRQIHQIDNRIMDIELFCPNAKPVHMIANTHTPPVVYLTSKSKVQNQYTPSQTFCMTLRKHLEGSRLSEVRQIDMDRILAFSFDRIEAAGEIVTKTLWAELLPSSPNLVLTEGDTIIDACLRGRKGDRLLVPGEVYHLPTNSARMNFMQFSKEELKNILDYGKGTESTIEEWLFHTFNGFSRFLVDELGHLSKVLMTSSLASLTEAEEDSLLSAILLLKEDIMASDALHIYQNAKGKPMVSPIALPFLGEEIECSPIIPWLEREAESSGGTMAAQLSDYQKKIHTLIKREERKIQKIEGEMKETSKTEQYKLWGNLLAIYAYENINGRKALTVENLFNDPPTKETIPVDPLLERIGGRKQKPVNRKRKNEPLLTTLTIDGFRVLMGKNNTQNEFLTLKKAAKTDLWLHARQIPGSHVVIETEGLTVPLATIEKAAALAAWNSKGKDSGKVDVDYTLIRYVKKIPNGPPGLVNYTHQKTIAAIPTEIKDE